MSWAFASLAILSLALLAGFAWYERTHPPSKVIALVATLAALAALGRIAFAPIPNIKPTTDIVLIAGLWLDGSAWDDVVPALEELGHRPVALTLPGQGDGAESATLEDQVAAVERSVLNWRFIDSVAARIDEPALREAQARKDAVRASELVYAALGA